MTNQKKPDKSGKSERPDASPDSAPPPLEHEEVARLAYAYWEARGHPVGSPETDWLRAEQNLLLERMVWGPQAAAAEAGSRPAQRPARRAAKA